MGITGMGITGMGLTGMGIVGVGVVKVVKLYFFESDDRKKLLALKDSHSETSNLIHPIPVPHNGSSNKSHSRQEHTKADHGRSMQTKADQGRPRQQWPSKQQPSQQGGARVCTAATFYSVSVSEPIPVRFGKNP